MRLQEILFNRGKPLPKAPKERLRELCEARKKREEMTAGDLVYAALRASEAPCCARDIAEATGLSAQVIGYHLDRFFKAEVINRHDPKPRPKGKSGQAPFLWSLKNGQ